MSSDGEEQDQPDQEQPAQDQSQQTDGWGMLIEDVSSAPVASTQCDWNNPATWTTTSSATPSAPLVTPPPVKGAEEIKTADSFNHSKPATTSATEATLHIKPAAVQDSFNNRQSRKQLFDSFHDLQSMTNTALEDYHRLAHEPYPNHDPDFFNDIWREVLGSPDTLPSLKNAFFNLLEIHEAIAAIGHKDTQEDVKDSEIGHEDTQEDVKASEVQNVKEKSTNEWRNGNGTIHGIRLRTAREDVSHWVDVPLWVLVYQQLPLTVICFGTYHRDTPQTIRLRATRENFSHWVYVPGSCP
jgi:hypothetical protein